MLAKLKEYKELTAIIVFFLGGFLWLEREFDRHPTRGDLKVETRPGEGTEFVVKLPLS